MATNIPDRIQQNKEYLIKQNELLQGIINRMANNSLAIKQVGLTVWSALVGVGVTERIRILFIIALVSFLLFGLLDVYYLSLEQLFRGNFNRLTHIICGFPPSDVESGEQFMERVKGNFIRPDQKYSKGFLTRYLMATRSWANLPYLFVLAITIVLWNIALPPS